MKTLTLILLLAGCLAQTNLSFTEGVIIGLQMHAEAQSACLVSYRYHRDEVILSFSNLVQLDRSLFFEGLTKLTKLAKNFDTFIE